MGLYTSITRDWLESRFSKRSSGGVYLAHMPVYGVGEDGCEDNHLGRLARVFQILRQLDSLDFESLLDVGGAEGYLPWLASTFYGAEVVSTDLSHEACQRAGELFGVSAAAVDCHRLPFGDDSFDVVVCSEVIEHVEHPVETMLELQRVARTAVLLTTEEVHFDREWIDGYLFRRPGWPHMERNLFHPDDLAACFPGAMLLPQCDERPDRAAPSHAQARAWLLANTSAARPAPEHIGIVVVDVQRPDARRPRRHDDAALLDRLLEAKIGKGAPPSSPPSLDRLVPRLRDPDTGAEVLIAGDAVGTSGAKPYPVRAGVVDFVRLDRQAPSRGELAELLRQHHPGRVDDLLELRDRLHLPDRWSQDVFDLRQVGDRRGFWPNDQLQPRDGGEGFSWHATGDDPWVVTPCLQRPIREVHIELRVHAADSSTTEGTGQLFWKGAADESFDEPRSVRFAVPNDGQLHTHRIVLADHPLLPDEVQWMRIDPIDGVSDVDLVSLRLL